MRKRLMAAMMSFGLAAAAVMPGVVFAEEETEIAVEAELETEGELETEAEEDGFDYSEGYEENGFFADVTALDYVTLPVYTGVRLAEDEIITEAALEAQVQAQIDNLLAAHPIVEEITEGVVEDGDTLNIDYVGSVDGVEFDRGSTQGMGQEVTIGVTNFIDDFLYQLIGHEVGETVDVEVTFPDPYQNNPDLAGKDALFVTTINAIIERSEAEFNDEFVQEYLDAESAEEYRQSLQDQLYENYTINALLTWLLMKAGILG